MSENQNPNFNSSGIPLTSSTGDVVTPAGSPVVENSSLPVKKTAPKTAEAKPAENKVVKLLEKNHLGMTLPEMAGGPRQLKRIRTLRPILAEAIKIGLVMPVSQRAGHTVYRLVKNLGPR